MVLCVVVCCHSIHLLVLSYCWYCWSVLSCQACCYQYLCCVQGVPLRVELGPHDVAGKRFVCVSRDNSEKQTLLLEGAVEKVKALLVDIHDRMLQRLVCMAVSMVSIS